MRWPNRVVRAKPSCRWIGLVSPDTPAYATISASVTVLPNIADMPTLRSSRYRPFMAAKSDNRVFSPLRVALLPCDGACATVGMNDRSHMTVQTGKEAETVAAGLASAASRHFGGPATIEGLRRESGGASRQTWSFD